MTLQKKSPCRRKAKTLLIAEQTGGRSLHSTQGACESTKAKRNHFKNTPLTTKGTGGTPYIVTLHFRETLTSYLVTSTEIISDLRFRNRTDKRVASACTELTDNVRRLRNKVYPFVSCGRLPPRLLRPRPRPSLLTRWPPSPRSLRLQSHKGAFQGVRSHLLVARAL